MNDILKISLQLSIAIILLWLSSIASLSFNDIMLPISFQSMTVIVVPLICRPKIGVIAVLLYLILGALGVPILAGGVGGYKYFLSTSGGYLVGFFVIALIAGVLKSRIKGHNTFLKLFLFFIFLHVILTFCGVSWFWINGIATPFTEHVSPFMPGAVIKSLIGATLVEIFWQLNRKYKLI